jgi:hypothetical protein
MIKWIHSILMALLMTAALSACDVHEFPDTPEGPAYDRKCVLRLRFDNAGFDYLETVSSETRGHLGSTLRDLRVTVRLYPVESGVQHPSREPAGGPVEIFSATFSDDGTHPEVEVPLNIEAGEYRVLAWADHVEKGSAYDLYYTVSDLMEIRIPGAGSQGYTHKGNDPYREAWRGTTTIAVDSDGKITSSARDADEGSAVILIYMERPLARYHFITNDLRKFMESETRRLTETGDDRQSPDTDDYRVVMRYTGYMNCAYNVLTDKPVDSATGIAYEGRIMRLDDDRAELAFDHVFTGRQPTSVQVAMELYRRSDSKRLSSTGVIDVPLQRGRYTLVEGPMLTTDAGASTGINPDFFGDFNIEIH